MTNQLSSASSWQMAPAGPPYTSAGRKPCSAAATQPSQPPQLVSVNARPAKNAHSSATLQGFCCRRRRRCCCCLPARLHGAPLTVVCKGDERLVHQPHRQRLAPALAGAPVAPRAVAEHLHAANLETQRRLRRRLVLVPAQFAKGRRKEEGGQCGVSVAGLHDQHSGPPQAAP